MLQQGRGQRLWPEAAVALGLAGPLPFAPSPLRGALEGSGGHGDQRGSEREEVSHCWGLPPPGDAGQEQRGQDRPAWSLLCPPDPLLALLRFPCPTHEGLFPSLASGPTRVSFPALPRGHTSCPHRTHVKKGEKTTAQKMLSLPLLSRQLPTSLQANDLAMSLTPLPIQERGGGPGPTLPVC